MTVTVNVNASIFNYMQNIWDSTKDSSKINLALCGSIASMMKRIFENFKALLFGRATSHIAVRPFAINTIKNILSNHHRDYANENLLAFYMMTDGVAKYIEQLVNKKAFTKKTILAAST